MAGAIIDEFTTLMGSTGPSWMRNAEDFVNAMSRNNYTQSRILGAGNMTEMLQGGDSITDRILLSTTSTFARYNINESKSYANSQPGTNWTAQWAFAWADVSWTKQDVGLNIESMGKKHRAQVYKRVLTQKYADMYTDVCNAMDDEYWAQPNTLEMESSTPNKRQPYSIPVFVNEHARSLPGARIDVNGTLWTTREGITTTGTVNSKWMCYSVGGNAATAENPAEGYTFDATAGANTAVATASLFPAFSRAYHKLHFDKLPKGGQYSDKESSPQVIWCSLQGINNYEMALRLNQDTFRGVGKSTGQDPAYDGPTFRRMPLEYIQALDGQASRGDSIHGPLLHDDGVEAVDEDGIAADNSAAITDAIVGPRYYFINTNYLKFVAHVDNYCTMTAPMNDRTQPFTWSRVLDLWNNNICRAPHRLGSIGPASDVISA